MIPQDDLSPVQPQLLKSAQSWQQQFKLLTQWGRLIQRKPQIHTDDNRIKGCAAAAWLAHETDVQGHHFFAFDSDSRVINGLAAVLLAQVNAATTDQLKASNWQNRLSEYGVSRHLTPSRNNGLHALIAKLQIYLGTDVS